MGELIDLKPMRLKYLLLSILLIGGIDLFAQDSQDLYSVYDFSLRNAVYECFSALQSGTMLSSGLLLSEQAVAEDPNFPDIVRTMLMQSRADLQSSGSSLSPVKPYVKFDYRYVSRNDVSYVIGIAVAELKYQDSGVSHNLTSRPIYLVYTDKGWRVFSIGRSWNPARFVDKDRLVIQEENGSEGAISDLVGRMRDEFVSKLVGVEVKPEPQVEPNTESKNVTEPVQDPIDPITYEQATVKPTFGSRPASSFSEWVQHHVKYPDSARKRGLSGTTKVNFVIDEEGNVKDVKVEVSAGQRTKQEFEEQMKMASYIVTQYKNRLEDLKNKNGSIQSIMDTQKQYEQAQQRANRLKKLYASKNYVLPEYDILDKEAVRVVASSPQWEPGEYREFPVPVEYSVSVVMKP